MKNLPDSQICSKISAGPNSWNLKTFSSIFFTIYTFKRKLSIFFCRIKRFRTFRLDWLMMVAMKNFLVSPKTI